MEGELGGTLFFSSPSFYFRHMGLTPKFRPPVFNVFAIFSILFGKRNKKGIFRATSPFTSYLSVIAWSRAASCGADCLKCENETTWRSHVGLPPPEGVVFYIRQHAQAS